MPRSRMEVIVGVFVVLVIGFFLGRFVESFVCHQEFTKVTRSTFHYEGR